MNDPLRPVKVGVIGCGVISKIYLKVMKQFPLLDVVACADALPERAQACAVEHQIPHACSVAELLADPEVELVVNLTIPTAHAEVSAAVLKAGKSVYSEKPLATTREDGQRLLAAARESGALLGAAPDTFLGGGLQTCRKLLDDGWIGEPTAAHASMQGHGPERWHPDPFFFYQPGGGPMFDMGPYYLTVLVALLGPIQRVAGLTKTTFPERISTSQPGAYRKIPVNTPTHISGLLEFTGGVAATIITSFDVWGTAQPPLELHGTLGSLRLPDPNTFDGPIWLKRAGEKEWSQVPLLYGYTENSRGLGVADMALALRLGRTHRASGAMAYHILDVMQSFEESSRQRRSLEVESSCERPAPLPLDHYPFLLDR
ncbi:MAG TPA: Gfo/Idh/MocA family oxidoreductase [Ktedonobacterales bacterium]